MSREINPLDVLIGFGFGIAAALLTLRLTGIVETSVSIWGQLLLLPALVLLLARHLSRASFIRQAHGDER